MVKIKIFGIPYLNKGSRIHIKKKNKGKFTKYCNGKVTQKCIDKAKRSGNPTLVKRATFAENSRSWKHENGGSVHKPNGHRSVLDNGWINTKELKKKRKLVSFNQSGNIFKRLDIKGLKTDPEYKEGFNWYINDANINQIQDSLINRKASLPKRISTLSQIIPESGGNPDPHGNGAEGLVGWRGVRAKDLPKDLAGQIHKLMVELFENPSGKHWNHGGKGTSVNSGKEMYNLYNSTNNTQQATKALMKGYVRPEKSVYEQRLKFANLLKRYMK